MHNNAQTLSWLIYAKLWLEIWKIWFYYVVWRIPPLFVWRNAFQHYLVLLPIMWNVKCVRTLTSCCSICIYVYMWIEFRKCIFIHTYSSGEWCESTVVQEWVNELLYAQRCIFQMLYCYCYLICQAFHLVSDDGH